MATWKKVLVSGSSAAVTTLTADSLVVGSNQSILTAGVVLTGSFTGSFIGDGSGLTGVTATSPNALTAGSGLLSDGTYNGSAARTFSVDSGSILPFISSSVFSTVSGDITITSGGVAAIASGIIVNADVNATAAIDFSKLASLSSANILVGNASNIPTSTAVTGDVTISNTGVTTIGAAKVTNANLVNSGSILGSTAVALGSTVTTLAGLISLTSTGFTGSLSGNASTATSAATLTTPRNINGVSFNGSADITVTAAADTLTGNTLNASITGSSLTSVGTLTTLTAGDVTITGNLSVAGTASFTNVDNLNIKDKFILINSGSTTLADSGWVTQYNAAGSGSAFYLEADSAGAYGRFAVAYDAIGTSTSLTKDEFVTTTKVTANAPSTDPTWGGSTNGQGNIHVNSTTGDIYIYS